MLDQIQQVTGVSDALLVIGTCGIFAFAGVLYVKYLNKTRGTKMVDPKEAARIEWEYIQHKLTDAITDVIEDARGSGHIRRELASRLYKRFAAQGLPELLPRAGVDVKRSIKLRLQFFDWTPVTIPGPGPAHIVQKPSKEYGAAQRRFQSPMAKADGLTT